MEDRKHNTKLVNALSMGIGMAAAAAHLASPPPRDPFGEFGAPGFLDSHGNVSVTYNPIPQPAKANVDRSKVKAARKQAAHNRRKRK